MTKTKIELICGFLESGKTTLIQKILDSEQAEQYKQIAIVQCEEGETVLHTKNLRNHNVVQADITEKSQLNSEMFLKMQRELNPDLILIEYNGTWEVSDFLKTRLPSGFFLDNVLFCANASTFLPYLNNTGAMMKEQISNADGILFNRADNFSKEVLKNQIKSVNSGAAVYQGEPETLDYIHSLLQTNTAAERRLRKIETVSAVLIFAVCAALVAATIPNQTAAFGYLESINTSFLGILVQAVPFLLIGVFVSSLLQIFVTDEQLAWIFLRHPTLSFPLAAILGIFFPVCDCAMAPIVSRLIRKGVPIPQAMVFFLAAPAVNPVAILSTAFAFPGQRDYVIYRIIFGMVVALLAGVFLSANKQKPEKILLGGMSVSTCSNGFVGSPHYSGALGKAELVFRHAGLELFSMGRFVVLGALVSSILQASLPTAIFQGKGQSLFFALLFMILLSAFMSVCSSSNAFISRSFLSVFPPISVMAFMVLGPMLDLSNLFMLSANFRKKFIMKLAAIIFVIGLAVFWLFGQFIGL